MKTRCEYTDHADGTPPRIDITIIYGDQPDQKARDLCNRVASRAQDYGLGSFVDSVPAETAYKVTLSTKDPVKVSLFYGVIRKELTENFGDPTWRCEEFPVREDPQNIIG